MISATTSITAKVSRYSQIGDREGESGLDEEEVEGQHVQHGGQTRGTATESQRGDRGAEQIDHDEIGQLRNVCT